MDFDWKIFAGFTALGILKESQKCMIELQCVAKERSVLFSGGEESIGLE